MSGGGYTPLFGSLTTGTLCGKWPDIGLWPIVLSLTDKNGIVDHTPEYIALVTGLALDQVIACMARFCQPDPRSRSAENDGARLVLLDPENRDWGWRVINHGKFREKARKATFDAARVEDGRNAERMRQRREAETRDDPTGPDGTRSDPPSDANTNTNTNTNEEQNTYDQFAAFKAAYPKRSGGQPWAKALTAIGARLKEGSTWDELIAGAKRYAAYCEATGATGSQYVMQAVRFCGPDHHFREPWEPPRTTGRKSERDEALKRFATRGGDHANG